MMADFTESSLFSPTAPIEIIKTKSKNKKQMSIKLTNGEQIINPLSDVSEDKVSKMYKTSDVSAKVELNHFKKKNSVSTNPFRNFEHNFENNLNLDDFDEICLESTEDTSECNFLKSSHHNPFLLTNNTLKSGTFEPLPISTINSLLQKDTRLFREDLSSPFCSNSPDKLVVDHIPKSYIKYPNKCLNDDLLLDKTTQRVRHNSRKLKDVDHQTNWVPQFYNDGVEFCPEDRPIGEKIKSEKRNAMLLLFKLMMNLKSKLSQRARSDEKILVESEEHQEVYQQIGKTKTTKKKRKKSKLKFIGKKRKKTKKDSKNSTKKRTSKKKVVSYAKKSLKKSCHYVGVGLANMSTYLPQTYYCPSRYSMRYNVGDIYNTNNMYFF